MAKRRLRRVSALVATKSPSLQSLLLGPFSIFVLEFSVLYAVNLYVESHCFTFYLVRQHIFEDAFFSSEANPVFCCFHVFGVQ